ncbi:hypothetical protein ACFL2P_00060 [Candidatus Moduliflexota bacterium]
MNWTRERSGMGWKIIAVIRLYIGGGRPGEVGPASRAADGDDDPVPLAPNLVVLGPPHLKEHPHHPAGLEVLPDLDLVEVFSLDLPDRRPGGVDGIVNIDDEALALDEEILVDERPVPADGDDRPAGIGNDAEARHGGEGGIAGFRDGALLNTPGTEFGDEDPRKGSVGSGGKGKEKQEGRGDNQRALRPQSL